MTTELVEATERAFHEREIYDVVVMSQKQAALLVDVVIYLAWSSSHKGEAVAILKWLVPKVEGYSLPSILANLGSSR